MGNANLSLPVHFEKLLYRAAHIRMGEKCAVASFAVLALYLALNQTSAMYFLHKIICQLNISHS